MDTADCTGHSKVCRRSSTTNFELCDMFRRYNYKLLEKLFYQNVFLITDRWTESITHPIAQHTAGGNNYHC